MKLLLAKELLETKIREGLFHLDPLTDKLEHLAKQLSQTVTAIKIYPQEIDKNYTYRKYIAAACSWVKP